jgi:hypothetical protein
VIGISSYIKRYMVYWLAKALGGEAKDAWQKYLIGYKNAQSDMLKAGFRRIEE